MHSFIDAFPYSRSAYKILCRFNFFQKSNQECFHFFHFFGVEAIVGFHPFDVPLDESGPLSAFSGAGLSWYVPAAIEPGTLSLL